MSPRVRLILEHRKKKSHVPPTCGTVGAVNTLMTSEVILDFKTTIVVENSGILTLSFMNIHARLHPL